MEEVLNHYRLLEQMKRSGDNLSGCCPIHKGTNPTQFRVSVSKNVWNCFSDCKRGGNVVDFIARMEDVSPSAAAQKAIEWFSLDPDFWQFGASDISVRRRGGQAPPIQSARMQPVFSRADDRIVV